MPSPLVPAQILALAQKIKDGPAFAERPAAQKRSLAPAAVAVPDIQLCSGVYKATCTDLPPLEMICQTQVIDGSSYAWIDGVNELAPVLLPVHNLASFRRMGTLRQYLQDDRHLGLDTELEVLGVLCAEQKASATLMVRACELMHAEGLPARDALDVVRQWGELICELDQAERAAFQAVAAADRGRACPLD